MREKEKKNYVIKSAILTIVFVIFLSAWGMPLKIVYAENSTSFLKNPARDADGYMTYDCIWFGNYKQGTDATKSPIKWRVLKVDGDDVFLHADKVLDVRRFHDYEDEKYAGSITSSCPDITWKDSTVRAWLNGDSSQYKEFSDENFIDTAFSEEEQQAIKTTDLESRGWFNNDSCSTKDKVFLLSREEAKNSAYGFLESENKHDDARTRKLTEYAYNGGSSRQGKVSDKSYDELEPWDWWLRNRGRGTTNFMRIYIDKIDVHGGDGYNYSTIGICPAMHISLKEAEGLWSYAGTVSTNEKKEPEEVEPEVPDDSKKNYIDELTPVFHYSASDGTRHESTLGVYSDHMFYINDETIHYRNEFAQLSLATVMAGYSDCRLDSRWTETIKPTAGNGYARAANIAEWYKKLRFSGMKFVNYEVPLSNSDDKVAFSMAKKYINRGEDKNDTLKGENTVVAVVLRGGGYGAEWSSNFNVVNKSSTEDHYGFAQAAEKVKKELDRYIQNLSSEKDGVRGDLKVWICGYSRSAATANKVAHEINKNGAGGISVAKKNLYAYTFATPNVATKDNLTDSAKARDENIFNIVSPQDLVPQVPLNSWGYGRYGNVLWLPIDSKDQLWQRYTSLSGKSITSESPKIGPLQADVVYKIKKLAGNLVGGRNAYKTLLQEPLRDKFREKNQSYSGKSSDERYESLYAESLAIAGLKHTFYAVKGNLKNLGRVHEPEHYMARLDTMTKSELEEFVSGKDNRTIREIMIDNMPVYNDMITLDQALEEIGASVEKTENGAIIFLPGNSDTFKDAKNIRFTATTSSKVNIIIRDLNSELDEKQMVSFSGIQLSAGKEYNLNVGASGSSALLTATGEQTRKPDYDSANVSTGTVHNVKVEGGTADTEKAYPGQPVTIYATDSDAARQFEQWELEDSDSDCIDDARSQIATIRMPDHDITVKGTYEDRDYLIRCDEDGLWSDGHFDKSSFRVYTGNEMETKLSTDEYTLSFAPYTDDEEDAVFSSQLPKTAGKDYYVKASIKGTNLSQIVFFHIRKATDLRNYELNIEDYWDDEMVPSDVSLTRISSGRGKALDTSKYKIRYVSYDAYEKNDYELKGLKMTAEPPAKPGEYIAIALPAQPGYTGDLVVEFEVKNHKNLSGYWCRSSMYVFGKVADLSLERKKNGAYEKLPQSAYHITYTKDDDDGTSNTLNAFPTETGDYGAEYSGRGGYTGETYHYFEVVSSDLFANAEEWQNVSKPYNFTMQADSKQGVRFTAAEDGYFRIVINDLPRDAEGVDGSYFECIAVLDNKYNDLVLSENGYAKLKKGETYYAVVNFIGDEEKTEVVNVSLEKCKHNSTSYVANKRSLTCLREGYTGDKICDECEGIISTGEISGKTSHRFGTWTTEIRPTVFKTGKQQSLCVVCGKAKYRSMLKLKPTIKINTKKIALQRGQSTTKVKVSGLAYGDKISSWSSSNKLVKVSKNGKIMAGKKTGKATVTVKLKSGKKASVSVKVQKSVVAATKITVKPSSISIKVGKTYKLKPEISPLTCIQKIRYASSNKKVASVSSSGVVKGKKKGKCKIKISCGKKVKYVTISVSIGR